MEESYLVLRDIIPKERIVGSNRREIQVKDIDNDKIRVWYSPIKGNGAKPFNFPRKIKLEGRLAEAVGLYIGDGSLKGSPSHSSFSNKDNDLVKFMVDFFLELGADISDITFHINYRKGNEKNIKGWWSEKINVSSQRFKISQTVRNRYSTMSLQVNGVIFKIVLRALIEEVWTLLENNAELRMGFLRGLFAAEGCFAIKEGYINHVSIAFNPHNELEKA